MTAWASKETLLPLRKRKSRTRLLAGGLRLHVFEAAPVADDLVEAFLAEVVVAGTVFLDGALPDLAAFGYWRRSSYSWARLPRACSPSVVLARSATRS